MLVAHGSRDPRAERTVAELRDRVAEQLPGVPVRAAFLDHSSPAPLPVLMGLAASGVRHARVVPLLFAPGYHVRSDLPELLAQVRARALALSIEVAPTLCDVAADPGGADLLLRALDRRLAETTADPRALVLVGAGSSDGGAREAVHQLAARWSAGRGVPAVAAFASGPGSRADDAVRELCAARDVPVGEIGVGMLFLADGFLPSRAARSAREAGAVSAPVIGTAPELVELVLRRCLTAAATSRSGRQLR